MTTAELRILTNKHDYQIDSSIVHDNVLFPNVPWKELDKTAGIPFSDSHSFDRHTIVYFSYIIEMIYDRAKDLGGIMMFPLRKKDGSILQYPVMELEKAVLDYVQKSGHIGYSYDW